MPARLWLGWHSLYNKANFDSLKQTAIIQLGYGTNSKLQLQFDSRFWNGTGAWPGESTGNIYTDVGFQNTWDVTRGQPGTTGIIVGYTGGNVGAAFQPNGPYSNSSDLLVQQYASNFLKQLEEVWPGATAQYNGTATLSHPGSDPNLLGSYSCWLVGQYTLFSGYEKARQGKQGMKIHFAGEHCSTNFQGFMEGAHRRARVPPMKSCPIIKTVSSLDARGKSALVTKRNNSASNPSVLLSWMNSSNPAGPLL